MNTMQRALRTGTAWKWRTHAVSSTRWRRSAARHTSKVRRKAVRLAPKEQQEGQLWRSRGRLSIATHTTPRSWTQGTVSQEQGTGAQDLRDGAIEKVPGGSPATMCSTSSAMSATGVGKHWHATRHHRQGYKAAGYRAQEDTQCSLSRSGSSHNILLVQSGAPCENALNKSEHIHEPMALTTPCRDNMFRCKVKLTL